MVTNLCNLFLLCDHEEVIPFKKFNEAQDSTGFLALGVFYEGYLVFFDDRSFVAYSLAHRFSQVLAVNIDGGFGVNFSFFHYKVL